MTARIRIATRQSALALWQAEHVAALLRAAHAGIDVELVPMTTRGDRILDRPLAEIGGKGLFLKELEVAMLERRADIAVHSYKDVPMDLDAEFVIGAVLERADPADAFVSVNYARIDQLPERAHVGTSSLRRQAQLRAVRPDLRIGDLRGNVNTRLAKLDAGDYDAIILACAGLERLGLQSRIRSRLSPPAWLPAAAQGAIAVEQCVEESRIGELLKRLHDESTARCVDAERAMTRALQGNCEVPIAAFCMETDAGLHLDGLVGGAATGELIRSAGEGTDSEKVGKHVAEMLLELGAGKFLHR